jgi:hypothetical protein
MYGLKDFNAICSHTKHEGIHFTYCDRLLIYSSRVRVFEFLGSKERGRYQGQFESETMGTGYQQHIPF